MEKIRTQLTNMWARISGVILLVLFVLILPIGVNAQKAKVWDANFDAAMKEYVGGNYHAAIIKLNALVNDNPKNTHSIESQYFMAMSYHKLGDSKTALQRYYQIMNTYPNWDRIEDVYYMLGNIAFENEDYDGAINFLSNCKEKRIAGDAYNMKRFYLHKVNKLEELKKLQAKYPEDEAVGIRLAQMFASKSFLWPADRDLLAYLEQTFILDEELRKRIKELDDKGQKHEYNVGLMLPLHFDRLKQFESKNNNQFVVDIFNGASMALNELNDQVEDDGPQINIRVYDTQNDSTQLDTLLKMPEVKALDLILGPIYKTEHAQMQLFCEQNKITRVNPLSKTPIEGDSVYGLYFEPSMDNAGMRAAEFCFDSLTQEDVFIAGYQNAKDSLFVKGFMQRFDSLGGKNVKVSYFNRFDQILDQLTAQKVDTSNYKLIVVSNGNSKIVSNICSYYTVNRLPIPLFTTTDFVNSNQFLARSFGYTSIYAVDFSPFDYSKDHDQFFDRYIEKYGYPPSRNSYVGYEMGWFFGTQLLKHGKYFSSTMNVNEGLMEGKLQPYFNYNNSAANNFIPILKMEDYKLVPQNFSTEPNGKKE